jgi:hypothetical protein
MARPKAASLNSLAVILNGATPLYEECRLINNHLEADALNLAPSEVPEKVIPTSKETSSNHATETPHKVFEQSKHTRLT